MVSVRAMSPAQVLRVVNARNQGQVLTDHQLREDMNAAGLRIGEHSRIDAVRYMSWLHYRRHIQPRAMTTKPPVSSSTERYERHREQMAIASRQRSRSGRDIGAIPAVKDPARRAEGSLTLKRFCEIYFPDRFNLGWSEDHLKVLTLLEDVIRRGGLFALAMPRGSGKTSIIEVACIFAVLLGLRSFVVLIASTSTLAEEMLESIKSELENNELLAEDFPEVCFPIRALERVSQRAPAQQCNGMPTHLKWTGHHIVLPTIPGSIASAARIQVAGLTGAVRGIKFARPDGTVARPDFVIPDDPQDDSSASSPTQNRFRERLLSGAVLGLAGPGKEISGVMLCTVIYQGDMADSILDRDKHPEWQGARMKMVYRWSEGKRAEAHWEKYAELRRDAQRNGDKQARVATDYYAKHRAAMDAGMLVAWPERKYDYELSGIQHAWNLRIDRGDAAFFAEYQNEPLPEDTRSTVTQTADEIAARINGIPRGVVPAEATMLTAFVDVQRHYLVWLVAAWEDDFTGYVVDYGTFPDQRSMPWSRRNPKRRLAEVFKGAGFEAQLRGGLEAVTDLLLEREFLRNDGGSMRIRRMLIDYGWGDSADVVRPFCRDSRWAPLLMPAKGWYVGPNQQQLSDYKRKRGDSVGLHWMIPAKLGRGAVKQLKVDTNWWKSFVHKRLAVPIGDPSALTLWGKSKTYHEMFAKHLLAERCDVQTSRNADVSVDVWEELPGMENDLFDCMVGAAVAASMEGAKAPGLEAAQRPMKRRRVTLAELRGRRAS